MGRAAASSCPQAEFRLPRQPSTDHAGPSHAVQIDEAQKKYDEFRAELIAPPSACGRGAGDRRGKLLCEFAKKISPRLEDICGAGGKKFLNIKESAFQAGVTKLHDEWKAKSDDFEQKNGGTKARELGDFSAYLSNYHRSQSQQDDPLGVMEMPGQYGGDAPPQTSTHVLVDSVDRSAPPRFSLLARCSNSLA